MTELSIVWQRLVDAGQTCPRCGDTGDEVRTAAATLTAALAPLGLTVRLNEGTISLAQFEQAPLESNRILIAGRPVEEWLGGATGQSPCCDVCGPNDCRTITVDDTTYETVPADLITRAGLLAAADLLAQPSASHDHPCCDPTQQTTGTAQPCCGPTVEHADTRNRSLPLAAKAGCC